ncbi:phosphate ABC transporter permease PstA [Symbiobacterium terraclitae]|uniref:phosphate ABC transporter permease PstA n=1 Tax=Symbiobacterium terraclitae TaxID=557451 RepID=UPI0035B55267
MNTTRVARRVRYSSARGAARRRRRRWLDAAAHALFLLAAAAAAAVLALLLRDLLQTGLPRLSWAFLSSYGSRFADRAGILAPLVGSVYVVLLAAAFALPVGVATAIFLEFYAGDPASPTWLRQLNRILQLSIANLAGVPSIVYGLFGLAFFVRGLALGRSVLAAALTLALLVLPVVIVSAREALRAVPPSLAHAAYALGASRGQAVFTVVLPAALGGIMTGSILSLSRALGESAPIIAVGAWVYVARLPVSPLDSFTVLPVQIYHWASMPQRAFQEAAAAGILVLLLVLLGMNGAAIWLRNKFQRKAEW